MGALLAGCGGGGEESGAAEVSRAEADPPVITSVVWACDPDAATWEFTVKTAGWTGGGRLWVGRDAASVEAHRIYSTNAAEDETADRLTLELAVAADWREAESGSSTRFRCDAEPELSFQLWVYERDGASEADCRVWGAGDAIFGDVSGSVCEEPLQDTGG